MGQCSHALRVICRVHPIEHLLEVFLPLDIGYGKLRVEKLWKQTESYRHLCVFLTDYVGRERSVFEKENHGIAADTATMIWSNLRYMFKAKISLKLHMITYFDNRTLIENVGCF
jgi:hypothetical protein